MKPERNRKKWTNADDQELAVYIRKGYAPDKIAATMGRSVRSIKTRQLRIKPSDIVRAQLIKEVTENNKKEIRAIWNFMYAIVLILSVITLVFVGQ